MCRRYIGVCSDQCQNSSNLVAHAVLVSPLCSLGLRYHKRSTTLRRYLILHPEATWHTVPELSKAALTVLDRDFVRSTSKVEQKQVSSDGTTTKLLVQLQDGMQVEAVVMTYIKGGASLRS